MRQARLLVGDVRERLRELPAGSVQTVVTSPPYFGLRDYGTASWDGGDPDCDHLRKSGGTGASTLGAASGGHDMSDAARVRSTQRSFVAYAATCGKCGATRTDAQIGLEASPAEYVAALCEVFTEVWRVLRDDGTLWLNLGDSYAGSGYANHAVNGPDWYAAATLDKRTDRQQTLKKACLSEGVKPKDLVGIPWRVAFALQAAGWYLRCDIIWAKGSCMPESVTDRPTRAHEYLFLLAKSARYFYDADAIREECAERTLTENPARDRDGSARYAGGLQGTRKMYGLRHAMPNADGRNKRSVWTINPQPYAEAHFATFPEALVEPCILAGSRPEDLVLDPFCGSGTVGVVALRHGRAFVGIDLNPAYAQLAETRIAADASLFNTVEHSPPAPAPAPALPFPEWGDT